MKTFVFPFVLLLPGLLLADPPSKPMVNKYQHLWQNSPFTTKPVVKTDAIIDTTFDDWTLGGVSDVPGGYMVTLVNKKNPGETKIIRPGGTQHSTKEEIKMLNPGVSGAFKVERVDFGKSSWKETVVVISSGGKTGTMRFDDKGSGLIPAASAPQIANNGQPVPGQPPVPGQAQPGQNPQGGREGRRRVLPPPPNANQQANPQR